MTREDRRSQAVDLFMDEQTGLAVRAYADCQARIVAALRSNAMTVDAAAKILDAADAEIGRAVRAQMNKARDLLGRFFDHVCPKESAPSPPPIQPVNGSAHPARK